MTRSDCLAVFAGLLLFVSACASAETTATDAPSTTGAQRDVEGSQSTEGVPDDPESPDSTEVAPEVEEPEEASDIAELVTSQGFQLIEQRYNLWTEVRVRERGEDGSLSKRFHEEAALNVVSFDADRTQQSTMAEDFGDPEPIEALGLDGFATVQRCGHRDPADCVESNRIEAEFDSAGVIDIGEVQVSDGGGSARSDMDVAMTAAGDEVVVEGELNRSLSGHSPPGGNLLASATASAGLIFSTLKPLAVEVFWDCGLTIALQELEGRQVEATLYDNRLSPEGGQNETLITRECGPDDTRFEGVLREDSVYQLVVSLGIFNERFVNEGKVYSGIRELANADSFRLDEENVFTVVLIPTA